MSEKEITGFIKLQVPIGKANPAPPIGPALGQKGLNIAEFCKKFNAEKIDFPVGTPVTVTIAAYKDRSFSYTYKLPPMSYLIKDAIKLKKGSSAPGKENAGKINMQQVKEIAEKKMVDTNAYNIEACMQMVIGSATSMGLEVTE
ncbi:50S ribosomal protein L11 [Rickettsiales bacterium]|nr:50S ribosomal protein L11 [Rickettsiales bacterium]